MMYSIDMLEQRQQQAPERKNHAKDRHAEEKACNKSHWVAHERT